MKISVDKLKSWCVSSGITAEPNRHNLRFNSAVPSPNTNVDHYQKHDDCCGSASLYGFFAPWDNNYEKYDDIIGSTVVNCLNYNRNLLEARLPYATGPDWASVWHGKLQEWGFKEVARWYNRNSGNTVVTYMLDLSDL